MACVTVTCECLSMSTTILSPLVQAELQTLERPSALKHALSHISKHVPVVSP